MAAIRETPTRAEVPAQDRWDLGSLFSADTAWEEGLSAFEALIEKMPTHRGTLGAKAEGFAATLAAFAEGEALAERLGVYAFLRQCEDEGNSEARGRFARYMSAATRGAAASSWLVPEIQSLPEAYVASCLADPRFADFRIYLEKLLRMRPHVLSEAEERLLALQSEANQTAQETFSVLTNVDLDFGSVETPEGPRPLTQSTFTQLLRNPDRDTRRRAYLQFYKGFESHRNTIASLYAGSVKLDVYQSRARKYPSARAAALFPDDVPEAVYDNLVGTINDNLPVLHDYYELRKKVLKLDELRHYDVYVPLVAEAKAETGWDEAVAMVAEALAPLGPEYVDTLRKGLSGGWADRYENKGKHSGAFSYGTYKAWPYILMNYRSDVLDDVFTLAHEGGHSMHSWYSTRSNPFLSYNYTIFEAEVASTFNEQLLFRHLYARAKDDAMRASLLQNKVDGLLATLFRQTMFAEFERRTHAMQEGGEPLTADSLRAEYRQLLVKYFGPAMNLEDLSDLEGLRIPHFYNAFYVYKYATGISASIALSQRVLAGGEREREDYFRFLRSGGSRFPIEALKVAGVDMSTPAPVEAACREFASNVQELRRLLKA